MTDVVVATVNAGGWQLLYVDGECVASGEQIGFDQMQDHTPIDSVEKEWRIGDVDIHEPPETYDKLCEVTDV